MERVLGTSFEAEIREQPSVWRKLAETGRARDLARIIGDGVVLIGSGSSLYVAQLAALALRRRGVDAHAVPATEARLDNRAYRGRTVLAVSQSGRSSDLFEAIDALQPVTLVALTNSTRSPLAERADVVVDAGAGVERAVPASKSVTACAALLLWAASLVAADGHRDKKVLVRTADAVERWLDGGSPDDALARTGRAIASCRSLVVLGSDYGLPIASEAALKFKEACYLHAEGFAAGEFRHGSVAMVDASTAAIGIFDDDARATVARPMREIANTGAPRYCIGTPALAGIASLGPGVETPFNTLGWLVTVQTLALATARIRGIDSDAPRGLTKAVVDGAR